MVWLRRARNWSASNLRGVWRGIEYKDGFDYSRRFVRVPKREHYLAWRETKLIPHMRELTAAGEQAYSGCTVRIPPPAFTATSRISSA